MINIVVVEDEYTIRTGLCRLIAKLSDQYRVVGSAENYFEGLRLIKQYQPDLAICDIRLGQNDGLSMIEQLRGMDVRCHFVIVSGYSQFEYAQRAIKLEVKDYLLKPVMVDQLEAILRSVDELVSKEKNPESDEPAAKAEHEGYSKLVVNALEKIHNDYHSKLSLSDIAKGSGVTPEYLSALFSRETGTNFMSYLKKYRMEKALDLLLHTNKKIYEIALAVGYDDPQYFCRVFKEEFGTSPKVYLRSKANG